MCIKSVIDYNEIIFMYILSKLLKYLNIEYDRNARKLFLYTLDPKNLKQKIMAKYVIYTTIFTRFFHQYFGFQNLFLLIFYSFFRKLT